MPIGTTVATEDAPLTAESVMSVPTVVEASAPLIQLWDLMQRLHLDLVVVSDSTGPLGVVDRQDIWAAWANDLSTRPGSASRCVVAPTPCVTPDTPLPDTCTALLAAHHSTVMVLEEDGTLRGVVTPERLIAGLHAEGTQQPGRSR